MIFNKITIVVFIKIKKARIFSEVFQSYKTSKRRHISIMREKCVYIVQYTVYTIHCRFYIISQLISRVLTFFPIKHYSFGESIENKTQIVNIFFEESFKTMFERSITFFLLTNQNLY